MIAQTNLNALTNASCFLLALCAFSSITIKVVVAQESSDPFAAVAPEEGQPPAPIISASVDGIAEPDFVVDAHVAEVAEPFDAAPLTTDSHRETDTKPQVHSLSVEPGSRPLLPADRPAWVGTLPDLSTSKHRLFVGSLPVTRQAEVDGALNDSLVAAVRAYIDENILQSTKFESAVTADNLPIDVEFIRTNLIDNKAGYVAELTTSEGPMYQKWVIVSITPEQRAIFKKMYRDAVQRERLVSLGATLVLLLGSVSLSHLVLRCRRGSTAVRDNNALARTSA